MMTPEYRKELLRLLANTDQLICEWESLTVDPRHNVVLLLALKRVAELREVLADVERQLNEVS